LSDVTFFTSQNIETLLAARRIYDPETELGPPIFTVEQKYYCKRTDFEVAL